MMNPLPLSCSTTASELSPPKTASTWWEHRSYPSELASAGEVRAHLRTDLQGFARDLVDSVVLCAAELVANAVKYAPGGDSVLRVLALVNERILWLAIVDGGGGASVPRIPTGRSDAEWDWAEGQRGLMLVDALAERWGHYRVGPGRQSMGLGVWASFSVASEQVPLGLPRFRLAD
ncbi:ATP-binding protein [Nocardiopsis tropica]